MPMNSGAPGTPNLTVAKVSAQTFNLDRFHSTLSLIRPFQDGTGRLKIVVALYPFKAIEAGDLSLEKVINFATSTSLLLLSYGHPHHLNMDSKINIVYSLIIYF